jgi:hypothetical protein
MTDYLGSACKYLGVDKGSVIKHRQEDDVYIVIVDKGIEGCPKYRIPLSKLVEPAIPDDEPVLPVPAVIDYGLDGLTYRELQALARDEGIAANQSAADLRAALGDEEE